MNIICYPEAFRDAVINDVNEKCFVCFVCLCFHSWPRDVRRLGVELIGHQRRIISSVQTLRLQLLHEQEKGFHV